MVFYLRKRSSWVAAQIPSRYNKARVPRRGSHPVESTSENRATGLDGLLPSISALWRLMR